MKVIELLNKIANDDGIPMKILFKGFTYWYDKEEKDYFNFIGKDFSIESRSYLLKSYFTSNMLNEKVEIIGNILEEKKIPEKFKINYEIDEENTINMEEATMLECDLACRINEIIDYLDYLKSKGE